VYNEVQQTHRATVNSLISAARTLGGAVSLLAMGELADVFSPQATFTIGSVLVLLVLLLTLVLMAKPKRF